MQLCIDSFGEQTWFKESSKLETNGQARELWAFVAHWHVMTPPILLTLPEHPARSTRTAADQRDDTSRPLPTPVPVKPAWANTIHCRLVIGYCDRSCPSGLAREVCGDQEEVFDRTLQWLPLVEAPFFHVFLFAEKFFRLSAR